MGDNRALFASIGASALMVSAAAVSLLSISIVFAIGVIQGDDATTSPAALVLDVAADHRGESGPPPPVVVGPARPTGRMTGSAARSRRAGPAALATDPMVPQAQVVELGGADDSIDAPGPAPAAPPSAAAKPNLGKGAQKLGDDLSTTVTKAGTDLATAAAPLGPPVSAAVQQAVNALAAIVQQATNLLGKTEPARP